MAALGSTGVWGVDSHGELSLVTAVEKLIKIINQFAPRVGLPVLSDEEQAYMKAQSTIVIPYRMGPLMVCLDIRTGSWSPGQTYQAILSELIKPLRWPRIEDALQKLDLKLRLYESFLTQFKPDDRLRVAVASMSVELQIYDEYDNSYKANLKKHSLGISSLSMEGGAHFSLSLTKDNTHQVKDFLVESGFKLVDVARGAIPVATILAWWSPVGSDTPAVAGAGRPEADS